MIDPVSWLVTQAGNRFYLAENGSTRCVQQEHQGDVPHAFATHFLLCYFNTAAVANNTFVTNTFVFTTVTFVVLYRTEDSFAEKSIALRLVCPVVDGFRLQDLTMRSFQNHLPEKQDYGDRFEIAPSDVLFF
jgi:hypothetical protein